MPSPARTVNLAGREIGCSCHACAFFHTDDQFYRVLLPFIREGFAAGDRAVHIVDPAKRDRHVQTLAAAGIDAERSQDTRQLEVRRWEEAYLRGGHFDQDAMLALIQEVLEEGRRQNFPMTRLVANMEWALEDQPGVGDIVEYESRLNYILPRYNDTVVCTYDLAKFSALAVMDILRTHPMVIVGEVMQENPFYTLPDVLLPELAARRQRH
ncbi:MAG: sensory transduction histidine kinase [Acidobacteria bacterium]|nr:sensory transduction histidine kinase [Acidobacteriota bacterium]